MCPEYFYLVKAEVYSQDWSEGVGVGFQTLQM